MAVPTSSSSGVAPARGAAWTSLLLGLLGLVTLPAAIGVAERLEGISLLEAAFAIPAAALLSLAAIVIGRRVRRRSRQTLAALPGARVARAGRILGYLGLYVALTAALAVGFYGVLTYVST